MAKSIDLNIHTELTTSAKGLQEKINKSGMSSEKKDLATANLSKALSLLSKGAQMTAQDFVKVNSTLSKVIDELVKAAAGAKGVAPGISQLQQQLNRVRGQRTILRTEQGDLSRTKIINKNGQWNLRTAEANRLTKTFNVTNNRGTPIQTFEGLTNAALKGNEPAIKAVKQINTIAENYIKRFLEIENQLDPQLSQQIKDLSNKVRSEANKASPENSLAANIQLQGNQIQQQLDKYRASLEQQQLTVPTGSSGSNINADMEDAGVNTQAVVNDISRFGNKQVTGLGKAFKQFTLFSVVLRTIKKASSEAISTIKELDQSLTDQSMVTGKSREEVYKLLTSYQDMAKELGATTKEIATVATEYMRQGKTINEAMTLTQAAVSAAKVAAISATESVNYLTTALNGFQLSASEAMNVSDKFAAVAATSATNYEELAVALSKVASQANLAGMSIDYTTALLAKGIETTREAPETIGTALKTVIARMREISDYGETLSGDTDVNNVETQLAYVGIALKDNRGELRSTEEVLSDLGKKWDTLNSNQQAAVAKALAGTRQQSRLISMMSNYERVIELEEVAQRSQGATMAQMEKYSSSLEASLNRMTTSWEQIVSTITKSQPVIEFFNQLTKALQVVNNTLFMQGNGMEKFAGSIGIAALATVGLQKAATKINEHAYNRQLESINRQAEIDQARTDYETALGQARTDFEADPNNVKTVQEFQQEQAQIIQEETAAFNKGEGRSLFKIKAAAQGSLTKTENNLQAAQADASTAAELEQTAAVQQTNAATEVQLALEAQITNNKQLQVEYEKQKAEIAANGAVSNETQATIKNLESIQGELTNNYNNALKKSTAAEKDFVQAQQESNKTQEKVKAAEEKVAKAREKVTTSTDKYNNALNDHLSNSKRLQESEENYTNKIIKSSNTVNLLQQRYLILQNQSNIANVTSNTIMAAKNILMGVARIGLAAWNAAMTVGNKLTEAGNIKDSLSLAITKLRTKATLKQVAAQWQLNAAMDANPVGIILLGVTALTGAVAGLFALLSHFGVFESKVTKTAQSINALSAEIYTLNEKAVKLDTAIDKFDALDEQILKTNDDLESMNSLLEEASDILDDTNASDAFGGLTEKEWYSSLTSNRAKRDYLETARTSALTNLQGKRQAQINAYTSMSASDQAAWKSSTDANVIKARDAFYAINKANVYSSIDALKESGKYTDDQLSATEKLLETTVGLLDIDSTMRFAQNASALEQFVSQVSALETVVDGISTGYAEILTSSDYSLQQQVEAYTRLKDAMSDNKDMLKAFQEQYSEFGVFAQMSDDVLEFINDTGLSTDKLNELYTSYSKLQKAGIDITKEQYQSKYFSFLQALTDFNGDVAQAVQSTFGDVLKQFDEGSTKYITAWNGLINTFGGLVEQGILNMGQSMDKINGQIDNIYSKMSNWATMSDSERSEFLQDNMELFKGKSGADLLKAFESGNYQTIEEAMRSNTTLQNDREDLLKQVTQELQIELARQGDEYNAAYVKQLQDYKSHLEDENSFFQASLSTRLEQQQNAIDTYKQMLQQQQNDLVDSLNKRKDAYSKYFDAVNQAADDEDYEEKATLLATNLSKLGSSTNAGSQNISKTLEKQLEDLEKERLDTLRQRAQDSITSNIDSEVTEINNKFDDLLNNQQAMLDAMQGTDSAELLANLISNEIATEGLTSVGFENYLQTLQTSLGNYLQGVDWTKIQAGENTTNNSLVLNVAGQDIELNSQDQQSMYEAIMQALRQLGLK